jgi:hypothetical protein
MCQDVKWPVLYLQKIEASHDQVDKNKNGGPEYGPGRRFDLSGDKY